MTQKMNDCNTRSCFPLLELLTSLPEIVSMWCPPERGVALVNTSKWFWDKLSADLRVRYAYRFKTWSLLLLVREQHQAYCALYERNAQLHREWSVAQLEVARLRAAAGVGSSGAPAAGVGSGALAAGVGPSGAPAAGAAGSE